MSLPPQFPAQIVLAWFVEDVEVTEEYERFDGYNYRRKCRPVQVPIALMWDSTGDAASWEKAEAWMTQEHPEGELFRFPVTEPDPLTRAKRELLPKP